MGFLSNLIFIVSSIFMMIAGTISFATPHIHPTVHSCDAYVPDPSVSLVELASSIYNYIIKEGIGSLVKTIHSIVINEIFTSTSPLLPSAPVSGKNVLIIGGSYIPKAFRRGNQLGINIYLVDEGLPINYYRTRGLVKQFIKIDNFNKKSVDNPDSILNTIVSATPNVKFHGIFTLVEDHGPITAYIAEKLGLVTSSYESSLAARNKFQFRSRQKEIGLTTPKFALVEKLEDLEQAVQSVGGYPAFLKPIYGVGSIGAGKLHNSHQAVERYIQVQEEMDPELLPIYHFGKEMIVESVVRGYEIQLELFLYHGRIIFHSFSSQYAPNREWLVFPTNLTESQQKECLDLVSKTVLDALGLSHGIVHIELFYTKNGPNIIEVNNRLSRGFLALGFPNQMIFGTRKVDYWGSAYYLALDVIPPTWDTVPITSLAVFPDNPSAAGWENEGGCGTFLGHSSHAALRQGYLWVAAGRSAAPSKYFHYFIGFIFYSIAVSLILLMIIPESYQGKRWLPHGLLTTPRRMKITKLN